MTREKRKGARGLMFDLEVQKIASGWRGDRRGPQAMTVSKGKRGNPVLG